MNTDNAALTPQWSSQSIPWASTFSCSLPPWSATSSHSALEDQQPSAASELLPGAESYAAEGRLASLATANFGTDFRSPSYSSETISDVSWTKEAYGSHTEALVLDEMERRISFQRQPGPDRVPPTLEQSQKAPTTHDPTSFHHSPAFQRPNSFAESFAPGSWLTPYFSHDRTDYLNPPTNRPPHLVLGTTESRYSDAQASWNSGWEPHSCTLPFSSERMSAHTISPDNNPHGCPNSLPTVDPGLPHKPYRTEQFLTMLGSGFAPPLSIPPALYSVTQKLPATSTPTAHSSPSLRSKSMSEAKPPPLHPISSSGLELTTIEAPTAMPDCSTIEPSSPGSAFFRIEIGPGLHQIKDYNMHPVSVLRLNYKPNPSDVLLVYLQCDPEMRRKDPLLFLEAVSPKYGSEEGQLWFPALKVCKAMLKGRTKDFSFHLCFQLIQHNQPTVKILSAPFYIWSNVSQAGYPRDKRAEYMKKSEELGQRRKRH